jgi:hypothetical protein
VYYLQLLVWLWLAAVGMLLSHHRAGLGCATLLQAVLLLLLPSLFRLVSWACRADPEFA